MRLSSDDQDHGAQPRQRNRATRHPGGEGTLDGTMRQRHCIAVIRAAHESCSANIASELAEGLCGLRLRASTQPTDFKTDGKATRRGWGGNL